MSSAFMPGFAMVLLTVATVQFIRFFREHRGSDELSYFYDLSEKKLFSAPRTLVPPIKGINDDTADGVRAIVISTSGDPRDVASRKIAYLETYAPELKQQIESMKAGAESTGAGAGRISRTSAQSFTFVRRLSEEIWYPVNSSEAEKIMTEWRSQGVNGAMPVVCVP